jgi:hypothetical protein
MPLLNIKPIAFQKSDRATEILKKAFPKYNKGCIEALVRFCIYAGTAKEPLIQCAVSFDHEINFCFLLTIVIVKYLIFFYRKHIWYRIKLLHVICKAETHLNSTK